MKLKCLDKLAEEHKTVLRAVDVVIEIARLALQENRLDTADVTAILEILRVFGDELHQGKEETALFPVFTNKCERSEVDAVRHMLFEHDQDRSLMEGADDALLRSNAHDFAQFATRLAGMLRNHIYKEDNILFGLIEDHLSAEDDEQVMADFAAFDRDFENRGHGKLLHRLRMLEWKYLTKAACVPR